MENEGASRMEKRMRLSVEDKETLVEDGSIVQVPGEEDLQRDSNSEQVEMEIANIHEKIENFTQMMSELLESGKTMLKEMTVEFEERMISTHKEQVGKWQEEIKELRSLDAANEESDSVLLSAKYLLQNIDGNS